VSWLGRQALHPVQPRICWQSALHPYNNIHLLLGRPLWVPTGKHKAYPYNIIYLFMLFRYKYIFRPRSFSV
jgi:hypothetical protein